MKKMSSLSIKNIGRQNRMRQFFKGWRVCVCVCVGYWVGPSRQETPQQDGETAATAAATAEEPAKQPIKEPAQEEAEMTEEERIAQLGKPKLGELVAINVHIRESIEFKVHTHTHTRYKVAL